jgi:hypothetical protein
VTRSDGVRMTPRPHDHADVDRQLHHHRLRIRTVAVSFAAALASVEESFDGPPEERGELVERWRTWSLDRLARYRADLRALRSRRPEVADEVADLLGDLDGAEERVRSG